MGGKSGLQNSVVASAHAEVVPHPIAAQQQRPCFVLNEIASPAARASAQGPDAEELVSGVFGRGRGGGAASAAPPCRSA